MGQCRNKYVEWNEDLYRGTRKNENNDQHDLNNPSQLEQGTATPSCLFSESSPSLCFLRKQGEMHCWVPPHIHEIYCPPAAAAVKKELKANQNLNSSVNK